MPRYHFDVAGHGGFPDADGEEIETLDGAKAYALQIVSELTRRQASFRDIAVVIRDEIGQERFRVSVVGREPAALNGARVPKEPVDG